MATTAIDETTGQDDPLPCFDPKNTRNGRHQYSLMRAIDSVIGTTGMNRRLGTKPDGVEKETSDELAKRCGKSPQGFWCPGEILLGAQHRSLDTTAGVGAIPTILLGSALIAALRPKMITGALGAMLGNLKPGINGKLALPRLATGTTAGWLAEAAAPASPATAVFDQIVLTPKTLGTYIDLTRRMRQESYDPAFENVVIGDMTRALAVELDRASIAGTGLSNTPTGILSTSGIDVQSIGTNGGAPTPALALAMEAAVANANADAAADSRLGWAASPNARKKMRAVDRSTGNGGLLWSDLGTVLGLPALASTNVPSNGTKGSSTGLSTLIYGAWDSLLVNCFTEVDVLVNPYASSTTGGIRIQLFIDADVALRQPAAFSVATDVLTT